jgi:uncharacterized Ntn-hydrolase superfamily protein
MTFSIAARCARTGMFGLAISSSSPAVAARCVFARAGVGAAATQNITDPSLGPRMLDLLELGASAEEAVAIVRQSAAHIGYRQLALIDGAGRTAIFSGDHILGRYAEAHGRDAVAAGNLLTSAAVISGMVEAYEEKPDAHLGDRLIAALQAALAAGGEEGPVHSAGLLMVKDVSWPVASLRIDWADDDPIAALAKAWQVYAPQMDAYVTRALDPRDAPSYNVPGDP